MQVNRDDVGALALAVMRLTDMMSSFRTQAIDRTALGVLRVAAARRGARPTEIAEELDIHPSSVTRHAQVLERAGRLSIKPDPSDGRASLLEATPAGIAELWQLYEWGVDAFCRVTGDWATEEVRALTAGINRLAAAMNAQHQRDAESEGPFP